MYTSRIYVTLNISLQVSSNLQNHGLLRIYTKYVQVLQVSHSHACSYIFKINILLTYISVLRLDNT